MVSPPPKQQIYPSVSSRRSVGFDIIRGLPPRGRSLGDGGKSGKRITRPRCGSRWERTEKKLAQGRAAALVSRCRAKLHRKTGIDGGCGVPPVRHHDERLRGDGPPR